VPLRLKARLEKAGLSVSDLALPRDELMRRLASRVAPDPAATPSVAWGAELEKRFDAFAAGAPEKGLARGAERARRTIRGALERLERRAQRAVVARERSLSDLLETSTQWLRPSGSPQERVYGFARFAAQVGVEELQRRVEERIQPFEPSNREIDL